MFSEFNINYNNEPIIYRKGTTLLWKRINNPRNGKKQSTVVPLYEDMTNPEFFERHTEVLSMESGPEYKWPDNNPFPDFVLSQLGITSNSDNLSDINKK